jgi:endo-beta-N-acetylglucosaminidase D
MYYSSQPQSNGLFTAAELLAWTPGNDPINVCSVPLASRGGMPPTPRVMMAGPGYTPGFDADSQGGTNQDIFNFDRWQYIDIMISNPAVFTIPPVVWMNACHRNGVLILGSISPYQTANFTDFNTLMSDSTTATKAANQLVAIAKYYGFDGYMVDIESFSGTAGGGTIDVDNFKLFLSTLRAGLQANSPSSFLMYYETIDGQLEKNNVDWYFNELCAQNQMFFQDGSTVVSDGMFCNYLWTPSMIASSAALATKLTRSPLDVYMGVQVPPNGFDTWQVMQTCVQGGVSIALWGAAWPFSNRSDEESFQSLMDGLWGTGLNPSTGIAAVIAARPTPVALPFCTTFNQGQGRQFYWPLHGTLAYGGSDWNNLSLQDVVMTYSDSVWTAAGNANAFTLDVSFDLGLDGGSSLLLSAGSDAAAGAFSVVDMYLTAWPLANGLEVAYALQDAPASSADIAIGLVLDDPNQTLLLLTPSPSTAFSSLAISGYDVVIVEPSSTSSIQPAAQGSTPWTLRSYANLPTTYSTNNIVEVLAVGVVLGNNALVEGSPQLYVGQLVVTEGGGLTTQPTSVTNLTVDSEWLTLPQGYAAANVQLSWTAPSTGTVRAYDVSYTYTVGGAPPTQVWLGRTTNTMYWIGQFVFPTLGGQTWPTELQFVVQVIGGNGVEQSVSDAASVSFNWSPPGLSAAERWGAGKVTIGSLERPVNVPAYARSLNVGLGAGGR